MTAQNRLALIRHKVTWAKKHVVELERVINAFLESEPYAGSVKRNPQTRQPEYVMTKVAAVDEHVSLLAGDAVNNARSALDHLVWHLTDVHTSGDPVKLERCAFPVGQSLNSYKEARQKSVVNKVAPLALDVIDAIKPYKGGNDAIWRLHELNRIDKHRKLCVVGSAFHSMDIGPSLRSMAQKNMRGLAGFEDIEIPLFEMVVHPTDRMCPLKVGDVLYFDAPEAEMHEDMKFSFQVAFGELGVTDGEPVGELCRQSIDLIDNLIGSFEPFLT